MLKSLPAWESVPSTFRKRQRPGPKKIAETEQDMAKFGELQAIPNTRNRKLSNSGRCCRCGQLSGLILGLYNGADRPTDRQTDRQTISGAFK